MPVLSSSVDATTMSGYPMMFSFSEEDNPHSCANIAYPTVDIWTKFDLPDCPTPPLSPDHPSFPTDQQGQTMFYNDDFTNSFLANPHTPSVEDFLHSNSKFGRMKTLPDLKSVCSEVFDVRSDQSHADYTSNNLYTSEIKKDCMWNGRGHQPRCQIPRSRRNRSSSPGSASGSPVIGCVDPRSVFNFGMKNECNKASSPRRISSIDGPETPSDSEEEIDVVNVEKSPVKTTTLGVVSDNGKFVGTLVQRGNGTYPHLALVTTSKRQLKPVQSKPKVVKKAPSSLSVLIGNAKNAATGKALNLQLIAYPSSQPAKRKLSDKPSGTVLQVMRLTQKTPVKAVPQAREDSAVSPPAQKRQVMSLEGVSMVSNTGINRHRIGLSTHQETWIKNESNDVKTFFPVQETKTKSAEAASEKKKAKRKCPRKPSNQTVYDSPTSSPGSSSGDFPPSPRKRSSGVDSSGSDEDHQIRSQHNLLEKLRREAQRQAYSNLRGAVPELSCADRAPKVTILKKSKDFVLSLQEEARVLEGEKMVLQQQHVALQQRLQRLAREITDVGAVKLTNPVGNNKGLRTEIDNFSLYVN